MSIAFRFIVICSGSLLLVLIFGAKLRTGSQSSSCPTTKTPRWIQGATVYYNYGNISNSGIRQQIDSAAQKWTSASSNIGCGVSFVQGSTHQGCNNCGTLTFKRELFLAESRALPTGAAIAQT